MVCQVGCDVSRRVDEVHPFELKTRQEGTRVLHYLGDVFAD